MEKIIRLFPVDRAIGASNADAIHEEFVAKIKGRIGEQLREIAQAFSPSGRFAEGVRDGGSTTITFDDPEYGRHDPDASFQDPDAQYAGVVVEVAYLQKAQALPRLADEHILGSDGNIEVMVEFNIEYSHKLATLSILDAYTRCS
ncbi:uncharacterized protein Z520_05444 [Fonsecaea multimorphosa CBS 102226]|uniref:Uncharacterized protein n=1 Tax=Fonsecaea multimorphosa CBS 102226 TaxID=1442371 RepID=A0A0D2KQM0_9EURO|nr:uncharacterized protein Z520_05444 [Fonsecaea multimorphosa CBS 102226]KIX98983.1 hypothetical protein Z520_05444 [Fonsecaea multimorphosa CBS 102226]